MVTIGEASKITCEDALELSVDDKCGASLQVILTRQTDLLRRLQSLELPHLHDRPKEDEWQTGSS